MTTAVQTSAIELEDDPQYWIESLLSITHRETQEITAFKLSEFQEYYVKVRYPERKYLKSISEEEEEAVAVEWLRRVILKPRQIFASTIILACNFFDMCTKPGTRVLVMTQSEETTDLFRETVRSWCDQLKLVGKCPVITIDNEKQLSFGNLGSYMVFTTAGKRFGGRGTSFNRVHLSEVAWWPVPDPGKIVGGILPGLPDNAQVDMESTANGAEGPLHDYYVDAKSGDNDWLPIFFRWFDIPRYRRAVPEGFKLNLEELKIQKRHDLDMEQLSWRRYMKAQMKRTTAGDTDHGMFEQEYPEDDITVFLSGVALILDSEALRKMVEWIQEPLDEHEDLKGWQILKPPQPGVPYIMSCDTSEGKFDYSAAHIADATTLEQVAVWHGKTSPTFFAEPVYKGAVLYNRCMVVIETPGPGQVLIEVLLTKYNYNNLYYHQDDVTGIVRDEPGWPQNVKTRSQVIDALQKFTETLGYRLFHDRTLRELASLTWRKIGNMRRARVEAAPGAHDDLALAWGILLCTYAAALAMNKHAHGVHVPRSEMPYDEQTMRQLYENHNRDGVIYGDLPPADGSPIPDAQKIPDTRRVVRPRTM